MDTPTTGTPAPAEQPQGIQPSAEQPVAQQPPQAAQPGNQPEYTPQQVAEWRQQAQDADKYKKQYDSLLPEYTRSRQALAQLAGSNPQQTQQDPYSKVLDYAKSKGYDPETARAIAEMSDMVAQDRTQAAMQQFAYQQVGNQIPLVMSQAFGKAAAAFSNPKVQEQVQQHLWQLAQNGQFEQITPDYTANIAKIYAFDQGAYTPPAQQQTNANPFSQGMFGIPQGFSQPPQQKPQDSPVVQKVTTEIQARYGKTQ